MVHLYQPILTKAELAYVTAVVAQHVAKTHVTPAAARRLRPHVVNNTLDGPSARGLITKLEKALEQVVQQDEAPVEIDIDRLRRLRG